MDAYKGVAKAIAESMVMIVAADEKIHVKEQKLLLQALKAVWLPGYGGIKPAVGSAFREVKLAQDFGLDLKKKMLQHAILLSKIFSNKEKKVFVDKMAQLISADGDMGKREVALFAIFNKNIQQEKGFLSSVQTTLKSLIGK